MFQRLSRPISCAVLAMLVGVAAEAATLDNVEPEVQVNRQGKGYVAVSYAGDLQVGDTVFASPGGRGEIIYDDGCRVVVEEGHVYEIEEPPPCAAGAVADGPWHAGVSHWAIYVLPGAAVIGGLIFLFNDDDDKPASP